MGAMTIPPGRGKGRGRMARRAERGFGSIKLALALAACGALAGGGLLVYLALAPLPHNEIYCKVTSPTRFPGPGVISALGVSDLGLVPRDALVALVIDGEEFHTRRGLRFDRVILGSNGRTCYLRTAGKVTTPLGSLPDCPASLPLNDSLKRHSGPCPSRS